MILQTPLTVGSWPGVGLDFLPKGRGAHFFVENMIRPCFGATVDPVVTDTKLSSFRGLAAVAKSAKISRNYRCVR